MGMNENARKPPILDFPSENALGRTSANSGYNPTQRCEARALTN